MEVAKQYKSDLDAALKKGTDSAAEVLNKLDGIDMNLEILKVTQIGVAVGKLRKHEDTRISSIAKKLIDKWKNETSSNQSTTTSTTISVKEEKSINKPAEVKQKAGKLSDSQSSIEKWENGNDSAEEEETSSKKRKGTYESSESNKKKKVAPPPVRKPSSGGEQETRDTVRNLLVESLAPKNNEDDLDPLEVAIQIEETLYATFKSAGKDYKAKCRSLNFNLKNPKNPYLRNNVLSGDISAQKLCSMSAQEMASPEDQAKRKEIEKYHLEAAKLSKPEATTDQYPCPKCKSRKSSYYQMQTRSADEPMTTFVTCIVCNNRWKFC